MGREGDGQERGQAEPLQVAAAEEATHHLLLPLDAAVVLDGQPRRLGPPSDTWFFADRVRAPASASDDSSAAADRQCCHEICHALMPALLPLP